MPIGAQIAQKINPKLAFGLIGMLGPIAIWLSSQTTSFYLWWFLYSFVYAGVNGTTYITAVHQGWLWFPQNAGLVSGLIMSGFGISGLLFNNLALWLVNPQHEQASQDGQYEKQVYDNVPFML